MNGGDPIPNPYAPPQANLDPGPPGPGAAPTRQEVEAFAGKNAAYYWRKSARQGHSGGLLAGWNWASMFLNMLWMLYRRMFREFWIIMGILVVWGMGEALLEELASVGSEASRGIERIGNAVFAVVMGMIGNGLYLRRVRREVLRSRGLFPTDPEGQKAYLAKRGGTSWTATLIGLVLLVGLAILAGMVADSESVSP